MKETKIIKYVLDRFPSKDLGFIMDRDFTNYEILLDLYVFSSFDLRGLRLRFVG